MPKKLFKKGDRANPQGRRLQKPGSITLAAIKRMNKYQAAWAMQDLMKMTPQELMEKINAEDSSVFEQMVAACFVKVRERGDAHSLDVLLNRAIGKVSENITVSTPEQAKALSDQELEEAARAILEERKKDERGQG